MQEAAQGRAGAQKLIAIAEAKRLGPLLAKGEQFAHQDSGLLLERGDYLRVAAGDAGLLVSLLISKEQRLSAGAVSNGQKRILEIFGLVIYLQQL